MSDIKIENVVGSAQIKESLDLSKLAETFPNSIYNPEEVPTLIIKLEKPKIVVMLFSNGKVFFTGPKNIEGAHELIEKLCEKLNHLGLKTYNNPEIYIKNIVASIDLKRNLNLRAITSSLSRAEYNPKFFPGVIYKSDDPNTVIFLFDSGKIVCSVTESKLISTAMERITNELTSLGLF